MANAKALIAEGISGPRRVLWHDTAIRGHQTRGTGLLNNELYLGQLVWNRQRYVTDPSTCKRVSRPNPPEAWITTEVPEQRIIDDALWDRVKARQGAIAESPRAQGMKASRFWGKKRLIHLLTGLLVCGRCGGAMGKVSSYGSDLTGRSGSTFRPRRVSTSPGTLSSRRLRRGGCRAEALRKRRRELGGLQAFSQWHAHRRCPGLSPSRLPQLRRALRRGLGRWNNASPASRDQSRSEAPGLPALAKNGLHVAAVIDLAPGAIAGTNIEATLIVFRRLEQEQKLVGALRGQEDVAPIVAALKTGPVRKPGAVWAWLSADVQRSFMDLEHERLIRKLTPRGRHELRTIRSMLADERVERADRPLPEDFQGTALLFVPEYAGSRVTADLEEQTVKPRSVYRLIINAKQANPRFLAQLLNSPYGRHLRSGIASGATIQHVSIDALLSLELAVPDFATQERIARVDSDIGLLQASFREMQATLEQDWTGLTEVAERIDALKAVLDIERRIADWWRELPYPLATIYRRYQVSTVSKERLETLLHFFEMFAVYLAAVGASHVKALRQDWPDMLAKWLHPAGSAGIERADFGFWIGLAGASLKDTARITSDKELRAIAIETGGPELVQVASTLGGLGKATEPLDVARRFRNSWKGHGGHLKASDTERLDRELQQQVRDLDEATASLLRAVQLVRPGMAEVTDTGLRYKVDLLAGSDPTFEARQVEVDRQVKTGAIAFWGQNSRTMCRALPFFRLGAPQQPQETSFYVFNRVENGGFRWICYQEAREQEFVAQDEELSGIISLGKGTV